LTDVLLVTEADEVPILRQLIKAVDPKTRVENVETLDALDQATRPPTPNRRILSFLSGVIFPAEIINRLDQPAYNFHPGPPEVRGLFPTVFALYDNHTRFGATAHEIAPEIDAGTIVGVVRADIAPDAHRMSLEVEARKQVTYLFAQLLRPLLETSAPLPPSGDQWSGKIWCRADFDALCKMPFDVSDEEFLRRHRAIGEGPEHALKLERFGRTFSLDMLENQGPIVKGGRKVQA